MKIVFTIIGIGILALVGLVAFRSDFEFREMGIAGGVALLQISVCLSGWLFDMAKTGRAGKR